MSRAEMKKSLHDLIPGGCHTYSKGDDQFPQNAPKTIAFGKGAIVHDEDGRDYVDCSMGLTAVSIGHGYRPVVKAVCEAASLGTNFQRPATLEYTTAEKFLSTVHAGDMVKFAKNGSTVTTAALKLARAFTGKSKVAVPVEHPFFSYDDWFISTKDCSLGIPASVAPLTKTFSYNDAASLHRLLSGKDHDFACVMMEPVKFDEPRNDFLSEVREMCTRYRVVLVMDEMVTGFKWGLQGAQSYFGVEGDLVTWGKGIANGFSTCALTGKAEIMEVGGNRIPGQERVFLMSSTHGAETTGLAAVNATIDAFQAHDMIEGNWKKGADLKKRLTAIIHAHSLSDHLHVHGYPCFMLLSTKDHTGLDSIPFRTLFLQEMISQGVLFQGLFYPTWSHGEAEISRICFAFEASCKVYSEALAQGSCDQFLAGDPIKSVFRKHV